MRNQQHPDTELLDRLRAGLLDDDADERSALENHLAACPDCQAHFDSWHQLAPHALGPRLEQDKLGAELQRARQRALHTPKTRQRPAFASYATAALLLIALSAGLWSLQPWQDTPPQLASQNTEAIPDLYEDLDFYLWLANQEDGPASNETGNPNNT